MFPRRERLRRAAFSSLTKATRRSNEHFTTLSPTTGTGYAVVISKKTLAQAVDRHRLKRRVLGALRALPARPPALILYPKASVLTFSSSELKHALEELLSNKKNTVK